jgi:hypothetical protein
MKYIVETRVGNTFENTWSEDDKPCVFETKDEAIQGLAELALALPDFNPEDYRIVRVQDGQIVEADQ